jgi:hypothetical protein
MVPSVASEGVARRMPLKSSVQTMDGVVSGPVCSSLRPVFCASCWNLGQAESASCASAGEPEVRRRKARRTVRGREVRGESFLRGACRSAEHDSATRAGAIFSREDPTGCGCREDVL